MALLVYITESCMSEARDHGLVDDVERFRDRVETSQSTSLFDPFPPPYIVKKKLGGRQGRLIADRRTVGEHAVIVFLSVMIRGERAYEDEFAADPILYGKKHFARLVTDEQIENFVAKRTAESPVEPKPDPSEPEYSLLYSAFSHHKDSTAEDMICETKEWVEQVAQERVSRQLVLLCKPCLDALGREAGLHFLPVSGRPGWGVWALRSQGKVMLVVPSTDTTMQQSEQIARRTAAQLEGQGPVGLLRASRRVYPAVILADENLWIDLEKEPVANMALSPEESEVLESARGGEHSFPLFINGRAGSGKSTILQYLFADLLFYYLSNESAQTMAPPIYLTANGDLLRVARSFVERLLRSEAIFTQQALSRTIVEEKETLDRAFREFRPHLLSLIEPNIRVQRYADAVRVDYARFRRMWFERFGKDKKALREYGPDMSWHVIRSYIKGMSSETYMEPEDYEHLPENQITVTHDAFKDVHDKVWLGWYQRTMDAEGWWDDQDLTRHVLEQGLAEPVHPAVFCDEAQDFTRVELELLLRLNLFSNRNLLPSAISRVPFSFAGDQFQTLNPTGFRWDSIKASFVEKLIYELDPARRSGRTDLNYKELKYNYRSTHKIVRFGNHVQAMRASLFDLRDLKPQIPWAVERQALPVVWFRANDALFWKKFRENGAFVVIVPCNEGEELNYVREDPILRDQIKVEDGIPQNVLSASRAKGCEYPAVLVYGFGQCQETDLVSSLLSEGNPVASDPDKSLPLQYFINRLYVAVSRAKHRLVVADTDEGFARLWSFAQEESKESAMLSKIKNGVQVWGGEIEGMTIGNPEDLAREEAIDPLENAKAFEADGLARRDAFLLRQAALAYRAGGDNIKAKECRARALEAEGSLYEAGDAFFAAGYVMDGLRCLWRSGRQGWVRLCSLVGDNPQIKTELEFQWACSICEKANGNQVLELFERLVLRLGKDKQFCDACAADPIWREAIAGVLQPLVGPEGAQIPKESKNRLASLLATVEGCGIAVPSNILAQVCFAVERFADAIGYWESSGQTRSTQFYEAKAAVEPYPGRIQWLTKLKRHNEVVDGYLSAIEVSLSPEQVAMVLQALRATERHEEAVRLAWGAGDVAQMLSLTLEAMRKGRKAEATNALHASIHLLTRQGIWQPLVGFVSTGEFLPDKEWRDREIAEWIRSQMGSMKVEIVRALARSDEFAKARQSQQGPLGDFLKHYLRVKGGEWRGKVLVTEAGAAFERGGRFHDAMGFYQAILTGKPGKDDERFAQNRWLICKSRQVEHEKKSSPKKAMTVEYDLQNHKNKWGIKIVGDVLGYPELPPIELQSVASEGSTLIVQGTPLSLERENTQSAQVYQDRAVLAVGAFKIEVSRKNKRCNITHSDTMETAYVSIQKSECGGEGHFSKHGESQWVSADWNMAISIDVPSQGMLLIDFRDLGLSTMIAM